MIKCLLPKKSKEKLYIAYTAKKNKQNEKKFASTAFSDRIVLVPQCMRNIEKCKAKEHGGYYVCAECGACKVSPISKKVKQLGYKALYILKGGRIVEKLIDEQKPKALLAVACFYEGEEGMKLCDKKNVTVQFVPLTKDGCVATDVNVEDVLKVLEKQG